MRSVTTNRMTKRKWHRIRGQMIAQQPSWKRHLRAIPYGSPEIQKATDSGKIDLATTTDVAGSTMHA